MNNKSTAVARVLYGSRIFQTRSGEGAKGDLVRANPKEAPTYFGQF